MLRIVESSRPEAGLSIASHPVQTSQPTTTGKSSVVVVSPFRTLVDQIAEDRRRFMAQANEPTPSVSPWQTIFTDNVNDRDLARSTDERVANVLLPLFHLVGPLAAKTTDLRDGQTYAMTAEKVAVPKVVSDYNPDLEGIDQRPSISTKPPVPLKSADSAVKVSFSPIRLRVWRSPANFSLNSIYADAQNAQDIQLPKGRYLITCRFTPDPSGERLEFNSGFQFDVAGKKQILEKAVFDPRVGKIQVQIYVKENLVWMIPLIVAGVAATGWALNELNDTLFQVDKILLDSWVPVAAAGGALLIYWLWKTKVRG